VVKYRFYGFDTETDETGAPVLLATNIEYRYVKDFTSVLFFLTQPKYKNSIMWTWNLTFDAEGLIKLALQEFAPDDWREKAKEMQTGGNREEGTEGGFSIQHPVLGRVNIFYIKSKFLKIKINKHMVQFYDIAQFYGHKKLETQAQQFLKVGKEDLAGWVEQVKRAQEGEISHKQLMKYFYENFDVVGYYCMKDAELTLRLSEIMKAAFERAGISFDKPMSQAKIAEEYVKANTLYPKIPKGKIAAYHNVARMAFHGGMFETLQRGYFDQEIWDYDINSAYPATMSTLPHWANGEFQEVEGFNDGVKYGWYMAEFNCKYIPYPDQKEPYQIEYRLPDFSDEEQVDTVANQRIVYPVGKRVQIITRPELDFMLKHNFYVKVYKGIEWNKTQDKYKSPFQWVKPTYDLRQSIKQADKNDMRQYALKILLNSTYGKTAQQNPFTSKLTNFFYASYITAETRIKLAEVAFNHEKDVIDIATDGICLTCECPELEVSDTGLGEWSEERFEGALFIGSGIRQMFKENGEYETHARGLTNDPRYNIKEEMEKNLEADCLKITKVRPLHLNECITHTKLLDLDDINQFTRVEKKLNVNTDKKHIWSKDYEDFEDFLEHKTRGKPFNVKDLQVSVNT
jgi:hypothetical protein